MTSPKDAAKRILELHKLGSQHGPSIQVYCEQEIGKLGAAMAKQYLKVIKLLKKSRVMTREELDKASKRLLKEHQGK